MLIAIFLILHVIVLALMVGTLLTSNWVEWQDVGVYSFKGSRLSVEEGFGDHKGDSYASISDDYCDEAEHYKFSDNIKLYEFNQALCTVFGTLSFCGSYILYYELWAILYVAMTIGYIWVNLTKSKDTFELVFTATVGEIIQSVATLTYTVLHHLTFSEDCDCE